MTQEKPKQLSLYTAEELKEVTQPIQKATFLKEGEKPLCKPKYNDRIKCELCGKIYTRSNKRQHYASEYHQAHDRMNQQLRQFLFNKKTL